MENLKKEFIPYEQALDLKELGFDEPCFGWYSNMDGNVFRQGYCETYLGIENCAKAPLYQQAFRWFREKYDIDVNTQKDSIGIYHFNIDTNKYGDWKEPIFNKSYEEAELECLKKLIEIVKNK
jgi:hypothetical protein